MTEKKRFVQNTNLVMQNNEVYVVCGDEHSADVVTTALNELINENEQLKSELSEKDIQLDFLKAENIHMSELVNENKQLKKQLQKGEDVCSICNHQYLTKRDTDEYYIAKCKKEHIECSKGTVNYCEDFECKEITE